MSSCLELFCWTAADLLDTNSNKWTLNPEPHGAGILSDILCVAVWLFPDHLHIEEIESDAVEAFAVCVCGQGG